MPHQQEQLKIGYEDIISNATRITTHDIVKLLGGPPLGEELEATATQIWGQIYMH